MIQSLNETQSPFVATTLTSGIVAIILNIFSVVGNAFIVYCIISSRKLREMSVNVFIASHCTNDCLYSLTSANMVAMSYINRRWIFGITLCRLNVILSLFFTGVTLYHHLLIAIHRLLLVIQPTGRMWLHNNFLKYQYVVLILTRLIPIIYCSPSIFTFSKSISYSIVQMRCLTTSDLQAMMFVIGILLIPCLLCLISFIIIYLYVRKSTIKSRKVVRVPKERKSIIIQPSSFSSFSASDENDLPNNHIDIIITNDDNHIINERSNQMNGQHSKYLSNLEIHYKNNKHLLQNHQNENNNQTMEENHISRLVNGIKEKNNGLPSDQRSPTGSHNTVVTYNFPSFRREIRITKMFIVIFAVFIAGYFPYSIVRLADTRHVMSSDIYIYLSILYCLTISTNPIIYGYMNTTIRKNCKKKLRNLFKR
ncbi:hypothetical protein SNEBB_004116 [Seison nebaliae]|nr:hypothetical protein SNEBB_004116 [Seison nebaliae]